MTTHPNQQYVIINKAPAPHADFTVIRNLTFTIVIDELSKNALKLYFELLSNKDGFKYWISPSLLGARGIMPKGSVSQAKKELIEKGYIVGNSFYEEPPHIRERRLEIERQAAENEVSRADYS